MKQALRISILLLCLCFVTGCGGGGGGSSSTNTPNQSQGGRVAFVTTASGFGADGSGHITTMRPDGSGQTHLTSGISASSPKFSWDGRNIAFCVWDSSSGNTRIYLMNSDGSGMHRLEGVTAYAPKQADPAFSPDGNRIVFRYGTDSDSASFEIGIIQSDGTGFKVLTHNSLRDSRPCFSPDGSIIAFQRSVSGGSDIYAISPDGSGEHLLVKTTGKAGGLIM